MKIPDRIKLGGARFTRAAMAGVLTVGLMPLPAFAADLQSASPNLTTQASEIADPDDYVIAAAYAAANPAPEILGLNNPNQRSQDEAKQTYNFFGDPEINENPDPYLYNNQNNLTPGIYIGGRQGSPMSALNDYSTTDSTAAQNKVWELTPHIILGTGSDTIPANEHDYYDTDVNARAVEQALLLPANSYHPIGVTYNRVSLPTMIKTMYRLAEAADEVVKTSGNSLKTRYEDPLEIAKEYERYILGQKGAVKKAIDSGTVSQKTIALVQSYDSTAATYTIITDGIAEGTATTNRYLEAVQGVTTNYYDVIGAGASTAVKADQLKDNVDVIIIGGNAGTESGTLADYLSKDGLLGKTFFCVNWASGSAFGTTVNSVENAQNVGRILPCVYPEVLDQSDMIAYYYDVFYHLDNGVIPKLIDERMDGVRNWAANDSAALTSWSESDVANYTHGETEAILKGGVSYLMSQSGLTDYLTPTDYMADKDAQAVSLEEAKVVVPAAVLTDGAATPEPTVTYGSTTLVKDKDYTVSYENNTAVGEAKLTITAVAGSGYAGSKTLSFKVVAADNFSGLTATLEKDSYTFTSKPIEPKVTVTNKDSAQLTEGTDFVVAYTNNRNAAAANAENAPTATIVGIGDYSGTITKTFAITKLEPTVTFGIASTYSYGETIPIAPMFDTAYTNDGGKLGEIVITNPDGAEVIKTTTVNNRGVQTKTYTANAVGKATVKVTAPATENCEAVSKEMEVTVEKLASQKVTIGAADKSGEVSAPFSSAGIDLKATTNGGGELSYKSSDESIATVSADGIVTPKKVGDVNITVTAAETANAGQGSATVKVTFTQAQTQTITVGAATDGEISKAYGDEPFALEAKSDGDGELTYSSSDESIATVDKSGTVTILKPGATNITITAAKTDNARKGTVKVKLVVSAAASTVTLTDYSTEYTGTAVAFPAANIKTTGSKGSSTVKYYSDEACKTEVEAANVKNAGTYYVQVTVAADSNYAAATGTAKLTITTAASSISLVDQTLTYNGNALAYSGKVTKSGSTGNVTYAYYSDAACTKAVAAGNVKKAGAYYVKATVAADANYVAATSAAAKLTVNKAANPMIVTGKTAKVKFAKVKKAKQVIAAKKAITVSKNQGSVTYKKQSGNGKITVANGGKITVKKGLAKGTYTVKVKVTAKGNANYKSITKNVKFKVTVK